MRSEVAVAANNRSFDPRSSVALPWRWMCAFFFMLAAVVGFSAMEVSWLWSDARWKPLLFGITTVRHLIELVCLFYAVMFTYAAVRYVRVTRSGGDGAVAVSADAVHRRSPLAVIYLCCNDLDEEAVRSLSTLVYDGRLLHIIHDDSIDPKENARVDELVDRLERETEVRWRVMRRQDKSGGKPGALRWLLEKTCQEHEFFLLLDNDSYVSDVQVLRKAMACFDDQGVAAVQFRNRTRVNPNDGRFAATVSGAVDIFDAFATGLFVKLWRPFVGHNAVLRTATVMQAGNFTPGFFADDLDLTVRMALQGSRVAYRRDLAMEECHPSNYRSFSIRSKKWAHGCAQIIRSHLLPVLSTDRMTFREKMGFLMFTGFYITQVLMLLYMLLVFIVLPLLIGPTWKAAWWALLLGTIVPASIFLPVIAYLCTEGRKLPFFRTLGSCAATYGSTDLWTILGLSGGFRTKEHGWVPTNSVLNGKRPLVDWGHFTLGGSFLLVPLLYQPELLLFPLTWLFAAKFLFVPAVAVHYGGRPTRVEPLTRTVVTRPMHHPLVSRTSLLPRPVWLMLMLSVVAMCAFSAAVVADEVPATPEHIRIEVRGNEIYVDGERRILRGIHYGPWRPGTGPGQGFSYPSNDELLTDLRMIRFANADTILVYDPPARLLDLAHQSRLDVIYVFNIQWWRLPEGEEEEVIEEIIANVQLLHDKSAVIAWMLGNEIPGWVIDRLEPAGVREFLSELRRQVREVDPYRPVTHGNWPLLRTLDLDRDMDIVSYNVYPFYPLEVAVGGFGTFIRDHLMPVAGERPLIISEFGLNTLEATPQQQAEVLPRCWAELLEAGAQGGMVFAFADEWWKNYDNPIRPPDYWRRVKDSNDHLTHNEDPEEHYGIVTSDRRPKPAYAAVRDMFAADPLLAARDPRNYLRQVLLGIGTVAVFGVIGIAAWLRFREPHVGGSN